MCALARHPRLGSERRNLLARAQQRGDVSVVQGRGDAQAVVSRHAEEQAKATIAQGLDTLKQLA
eukprot:scaffold70079_cov62-Phaeocystis_antarctica.AAC.5